MKKIKLGFSSFGKEYILSREELKKITGGLLEGGGGDGDSYPQCVIVPSNDESYTLCSWNDCSYTCNGTSYGNGHCTYSESFSRCFCVGFC